MPTFSVQAVIFDLDGVIIDSEPMHERSLREVLRLYDIDLTEEEFDQFRGRTDADIVVHMQRLYPEKNLKEATVIQQKRVRDEALAEELQLVPDALAFIEGLEGSYRLALTTSATPEAQRLAFRRFGLGRFFGVVVNAGDIKRAKPDPEPYRITCAKLGINAADCLVIEDSVNGVLSAKAAGCKVAAITTSFDRPALEEAGADFVFSAFGTLAAELDASSHTAS